MPGNQSSSSHDPFAGLRAPFVRSFALGRMAAMMSSQFVSVAVGWELYERTGDPWALGLVGAVQVAPALVLVLPAGNLADRFPRRNVALLGHALLGLATIGLAIVSWLEAPVEMVYLLLVLIGAGRAFSMPSVNTLLAQLLKPREFANAYAWIVSSSQLASVSGPALGGVLIAVTGVATWAYVAGALGQIVFVAILLTMPVIVPARAAGRRTIGDLFAGVSFIRRTPIYLGAITLDLFGVLLGGAVALLPIYAKDILQIGPAGLGLLRSAPSLGALTAALLVTRLPPWEQPGRVLLLVVAGFGVATIGFGLSRDVPLSLACLFMVGACDSVSMVIRGTLQQVITPDHLRGRVASVNSLFIGLSNELGAFESGAVAALVGPVISVVGGGAGTLIVVGVVALVCPALARIGPLHTLHPPERGAARQPDLASKPAPT